MNAAQAIQEQRLRLASFNSMDGDAVADELNKRPDLWDSYVFGNFAGLSHYSGRLIELRDLKDGIINADTLLILTDKKHWPELKKILQKKRLHVDELGVTFADDFSDGKYEREGDGIVPFLSGDEAAVALGGGFYRQNGKIPAIVRVWWD